LNIIFGLYSSAIDILEKSGVTLHCDHLSQIIEMDASRTVGHHKAHPVLRRVIDPFLDKNVCFLRLIYDSSKLGLKALFADNVRACRSGFYYHYWAVSIGRFVTEHGLEGVLSFVSVHWRLTSDCDGRWRVLAL
jgi:hypothetical protein